MLMPWDEVFSSSGAKIYAELLKAPLADNHFSEYAPLPTSPAASSTDQSTAEG
jgi:hypothetical protein